MPRDIVEINASVMKPLGYVPIYKTTDDKRILHYLQQNICIDDLNRIPEMDVLSTQAGKENPVPSPQTDSAEFDWGAFSLKFCAVFFAGVIAMCCLAYGLAR